MAKVKISEFDVNPANNTDINNINIAEGCAPSGINNAIRQLMSDLKEFQTGAGGDPFNGAVNGTVGATTANTGAFTTLSASGVTTVSAGTVSAPAITTTGDTNTGIFFPAADTIAFSEGGVESMRIDSSGNVGIGTTSPSTFGKLAIQNGSVTSINSANGEHELIKGSFVNGLYSAGIYTFNTFSSNLANSLIFKVSNTVGTTSEAVRIDGSGNVGIGTSSPLAKLDVTGDAIALNGSSRYRSLELFESGTRRAYFTYDSTTNVGGLVTEEFGSSLQFGTSNQERMRIDNNGLLCINRTTATNGSYINISQSGAVGWAMVVQNTASTTNSLPVLVNLNSSGAVVGYVESTNTATSYLTSSDYRLKENIAPMTGALNKVVLLKPCTYTWKVDGSSGQGFIAHELQDVVPEAVTGKKDAVNKDGSIKLQGIDTSFLVATLTAAIQELKAIVDAQAERITALENK